MRPTAFGGTRLGVVALWCLPALTFLIPVACGLAAFGARNPVLGAVLVATGVAAALETRPRLASSVSPSRIDAVELDLAEHPRVRDALHRAALAARQPAPQHCGWITGSLSTGRTPTHTPSWRGTPC